MKIPLNDEMNNILNEIKERNLTESEWAKIESSDMFQTVHFCGGFDATEKSFLFSYYDVKDNEYWFLIKLEDILKDKIKFINLKAVVK